LLLISLLVCAIVLAGCQTRIVEAPQYVLPTLDAFEPPRMPADLIAEPMTDADLLHNSVQIEFLMYDWQDYADALKSYMEHIRGMLAGP
jgi:hypothetical protein